jgi:hypothetical protein
MYASTHWDADQRAVTIATDPFAPATTYSLIMNARDLAGHALGPGKVDTGWSFQVTADAVAPQVVLDVPNTSEEPGLTLSPVTLVFSEPMRPSSVNYDITPAVPGNLVWDATNRTAILVHAPFQVDQQYTVTVYAAKDVAGNTLAAVKEITFDIGMTLYGYWPFVARQ